jgi:hypothetical protein
VVNEMPGKVVSSTEGVGLRWWRLAGLFGLGWFVLFMVGAVVLQGEPPASNASLAEVRQFFTDHRTRFLVGDYLADLAFLLLFLPFVVGLRSLLGAAEGGPQIAARLVLVGGLATVLVGARPPSSRTPWRWAPATPSSRTPPCVPSCTPTPRPSRPSVLPPRCSPWRPRW